MNQVIQIGLGIALVAVVLSGCASGPPSESTPQVALDNKPTKETVEAPAESPITRPPMDPHAYYALCGGELRDLKDVLGPITYRMASQKIPYSRTAADEWRDCSGNFLRLSSYLAEACPELESSLVATKGVKDFKPATSNVVASAKAVRRTTRGIAKWYSKQGRFTPIYYDGAPDDKAVLEKYRDLIRPGSVLWFSRNKPISSAGLNPLFSHQINHMGTVVSVTRNERGEVVRYQMYHGRNKGKLATITNKHFWDWPKAYLSNGKKYPPLGYWGQYLVGIGTIAPVADNVAFDIERDDPVENSKLN